MKIIKILNKIFHDNILSYLNLHRRFISKCKNSDQKTLFE